MSGNLIRRPAVAGRFYPAPVEELSRDLDSYLARENNDAGVVEHAIGCVVPHAGYMYSGHVAGAVYRRLPPRKSYVILCPNHFGRGDPIAMMTEGAWRTPLGDAALDAGLGRALRKACPLVSEDPVAHAQEHSLEVQLPFLQRRVGQFTFLPVSIGVGGYAALEKLGHGVAQILAAQAERPLIIASSDMNHYEPDDVTRVKDRKAIDRILALDPQGLYDVLRLEDISMCGFGPAVAMLTAAKELGAKQAELVKYATSAETGGDPSEVVGYAGIIVS